MFLVHAEGLFGRQKYHGGIRVVAASFSATAMALFAFLSQNDGIYSKLYACLLHAGVRQIDNAYFGMQGPASQA